MKIKDIILSDVQVQKIIEMCKELGVAPSRVMEQMINTYKEQNKED